MIIRMSMRKIMSIRTSMRKSNNMSTNMRKSIKKESKNMMESKNMRESKIMSVIYLTVGKGAGRGGREVHGVREE